MSGHVLTDLYQWEDHSTCGGIYIFPREYKIVHWVGNSSTNTGFMIPIILWFPMVQVCMYVYVHVCMYIAMATTVKKQVIV